MDNYVMTSRNPSLERQSTGLGFTRTLFLDADFVVLTCSTPKELLRWCEQARARGRIVLYRPPSEELLRFALEKTPVRGVIGIEQIHLKDTVHAARGGLDQVLCMIAREKKKTIYFSFSNMLNSTHRPRLLARMMFNIALCRKYNVDVAFSTFATEVSELRSAKDLQALWGVLQKNK